VGLRAGLDWCGKSRPTGIRSPDRPARRQSLYRLRYTAPSFHIDATKYMREIGLKGRIVTKNLFSALTLTCTALAVFKI